jgi:hypothetical protein
LVEESDIETVVEVQYEAEIVGAVEKTYPNFPVIALDKSDKPPFATFSCAAIPK